MSVSAATDRLATASRWHRLRHTPLRDLLRGRLSGRLDIEPVLASPDLPVPLAELVRLTVRRTRLWRLEKVEVARELAAGFIFTFHFFNVHFRMEKFPMDPVIFSGRMTRAEMLHERKRWYDRLGATRRLDEIRLRDEWSQWKRVMHPLGFLAFSIGTVLLVLIFYAMGTRLFGH